MHRFPGARRPGDREGLTHEYIYTARGMAALVKNSEPDQEISNEARPSSGIAEWFSQWHASLWRQLSTSIKSMIVASASQRFF